MTYNTPGVYVEEITKLPPSVAPVNTAIPAFIGYTEKRPDAEPHRITSMLEYEELFGRANNEFKYIGVKLDGTIEFSNIAGTASIPEVVDTSGSTPVVVTQFESGIAPISTSISSELPAMPKFKMWYSLVLYFANGGGPCYIVSINTYDNVVDDTFPIKSLDFITGLNFIKKKDEPTLILFPDLLGLLKDDPDSTTTTPLPPITDSEGIGYVYQQAINQCATLQDRFLITDVVDNEVSAFRNSIGTSNLKYASAYYPNLETIYTHQLLETTPDLVYYYEEDPSSGSTIITTMVLRRLESEIESDPSLITTSLFHFNNKKYHEVMAKINARKLILPPSAAVAGIYATVDRNRGVWKAPANVSLAAVRKPTIKISDEEQRGLNVDTTAGKSINAIRSFTGRGTLVWGARTLAGNDNEWRYVSVRRFFIMTEESIKKATQQFVFENNDANTWVKVKSMINNFLTLQWRAGALYGDKPNEAFFVKVGQGETMSSQDILEGRMIIEIGMAVVRPAEFIILRFSHFMQET